MGEQQGRGRGTGSLVVDSVGWLPVSESTVKTPECTLNHGSCVGTPSCEAVPLYIFEGLHTQQRVSGKAKAMGVERATEEPTPHRWPADRLPFLKSWTHHEKLLALFLGTLHG